MKMMNVNLLKSLKSKWRNVGSRGVPFGAACGNCRISYVSRTMEENKSVPRDVRKGHMIVCVGENHKRHIINISLLEHPLFSALLGVETNMWFATDSKLCIHCDEYVFLKVRRASHSDEKRCFFCL